MVIDVGGYPQDDTEHTCSLQCRPDVSGIVDWSGLVDSDSYATSKTVVPVPISSFQGGAWNQPGFNMMSNDRKIKRLV